MKTLQAHNAKDVRYYDTERLREEFLLEELFKPDAIEVVYSHTDRLVIMGIMPKDAQLSLDEYINPSAFGTDYFLQRREMGVVNLGGPAKVTWQGGEETLANLDGLYLSLDTQNVAFSSVDAENPALLYALSAPAHAQYPTTFIPQDKARRVELGSLETANDRVITQYLHPDVLTTCQLCMGITHLNTGSVWNTMPAHTHERRMEAYLYFNIKPEQVVFHLMGEPTQTRHIVMQNLQAVISPSWSIHSGCGTQNYSFVWGMVGENQTFDDMDFVKSTELR